MQDRLERMVNPKELPLGSVAYFVDRYRGRDAAGNVRWMVDLGIVEEHYPSAICLTKLEPADRRTINGIRHQDFATPTRWMKLPKGWTYDTRLFEEGVDETVPDGRAVDPRDPQAVLDAYKSGALVQTWDFDHSRIVVQLGGEDGDSVKGTYRLIRNHNACCYIPPYESVAWREVYKTYAEAEAVIRAHEAELARVAALSDYDWSVEQIRNTLDRWAGTDQARADKKKLYLDWLLNQENVEDLEARVFGDTVQWKPWKAKRWMNIAL